MSMQDPISDMILRIKNAQARGHSKVSFASSKLKKAICEVLSDEGFIKKVEVIEADSKKNIEVTLKYFEDKPVIKEFQRESKPGLRRYFGSKDISPSSLINLSMSQSSPDPSLNKFSSNPPTLQNTCFRKNLAPSIAVPS